MEKLTKKSPLARNRATLQTESLYGDVTHSAWVAQLSMQPCINESNANLSKLIQITKTVINKIKNYKANPRVINFNRPILEILKQIYALFLLRHNGQTKYADYVMNDGKIMSFRLGLHDADGRNFEEGNYNVSVFIAYHYYSNRGMTNTPYQEYEINPKLFEKNPKLVTDALANAVEQAIENGKFVLDSNIGRPIDTTKQDSLEDIIARFSKLGVYTFKGKDKLRYNLKLCNVIKCTLDEIRINTICNNANKELYINKQNETYIDNIELIPTKKVKNTWREFIRCLFRWASRNNQQNINCNRNMNTNRIRLTESQLHNVIKESVKRVLNEWEDPNDGVDVPTKFDDLYNIKQYIDKAINALEHGNKESYNRSVEIIRNKANNIPML